MYKNDRNITLKIKVLFLWNLSKIKNIIAGIGVANIVITNALKEILLPTIYKLVPVEIVGKYRAIIFW